MGQFYYVDMRLKVLDDSAFIAATKKLVASEKIDPDCLKKFDGTSVLGCVRFMLAAEFQGPLEAKDAGDEFIDYAAEFHATYSWSSLLWGWWDYIEPHIECGSRMHIQEDEGSWIRRK